MYTRCWRQRNSPIQLQGLRIQELAVSVLGLYLSPEAGDNSCLNLKSVQSESLDSPFVSCFVWSQPSVDWISGPILICWEGPAILLRPVR